MTAGSIFVPQIIPIRVPPPGKAKNHIDTTTPVEIKSDSRDVSIFYTVDGSKPVPVKKPGFGENTTMKYRGPVHLPEGKVSVRALAVSSDGRESAIVTKLFLVDYVPMETIESTEDNEDNFLRQYIRDVGPQEAQGRSSAFNLSGSLRSAWEDTTRSFQGVKVQGRCPQCLSPRPSDPFARFCPQCGTPVPPLPEQRLPPTEGGQMRLCVHCKMMGPLSSPVCVVCEAPMGPQPLPQASLRLTSFPQDKVICPSCGAGHPANLTYCAVCETRLPEPPTATLGGGRAPPLPSSDGRMIFCSNCSRVNNCDARYCDWCGAKPGHPAPCLACSRCGANSERYATYCGSCGAFLEGPVRVSAGASYSAGGAMLQSSSLRSEGVSWLPVPLPQPPIPPPCSDQHTQTVGLFYPSGTELQKKGQQVALELTRQEQMRDRRPLLTPISPGRGYWRKQLDHICAHFRSYAQNNAEFRTLVGEPRMGKLLSATVQEESDEVSVRINFVSAGSERSKGGEKGKSASQSELLPQNSVTDSLPSQSACEHSAPCGDSRKDRKQRRATRLQEEEETLLQSKDTQLLSELGPGGRGRGAVVQQLLEEGADPSCRGYDGRPALTVAVMNLRHELLPLLLHRGADVDQQSGPVNNSALHEAAALGNQALQCAEILLGFSASIRQRNGRGQTAYDLAVRSGCGPLVSLIAARTGQGLLDKLAKPGTPSAWTPSDPDQNRPDTF
ncbi:hypothetical protein COCON_G00039730 [Conger conger]|uniref:Double zinc ribbon and ankyrin repeat-containing protein 1 n=1 Tax=Conger conger TaxID=82655 RepID=A0A9Q1E0B6_CONCO|nr:hypothetical protein COCON_G00039730 [Conger conger]